MSQTLHSVVKRCTQAVHPSKKQKKHSREHSLDIDSGDDKGHDSAGSYIEDDARQSKHHSERVQRIRKSIMKLDNKCRPYILLYVARPESILMRNGKAQMYMSQTMKDALGMDNQFATELHATAHSHAQNQVASQERVVALNSQVHAAREERRKMQHQIAVLQRQMDEERVLRAAAEPQLKSLQQTHPTETTTNGGVA